MDFTIVLNDKCNLACDYCCVLDSLNQGNEISNQNVFKFFDWQLPLYSKEKIHTVEFFGGEPTLSWDRLKDVMNYLDLEYSDYKIEYRIYTNCIFNNKVRYDSVTWNRFSDIICSIDGDFITNQLRTKSKKLHTKSIENFQYLLTTGHAGIAFVLHPETPLDAVYKYFDDMGTRYYHFEIATLWNDNTDNNITLKYLFDTFKFITNKILVNNINCPENFKLFSIPRELLSPENFFTNPKHVSCMDGMRSLSPKGNIYFCRDLAVSEEHLLKESIAQSNYIFKEKSFLPYNIQDLQLDVNSNDYSEIARGYDKMTSCPVKSFEYKHFVKNVPGWITDKDFQDIIIAPLFNIMMLTFSGYNNNYLKDPDFLDNYKKKVNCYISILETYEQYL